LKVLLNILFCKWELFCNNIINIGWRRKYDFLLLLCIPLLELITKIVNTYIVFVFTWISRLKPPVCLCSTAHFATWAKYNFGDDEKNTFIHHICGYRQLVGVICICYLDVNQLIPTILACRAGWHFSVSIHIHIQMTCLSSLNQT
jgi:hypothetical protein